MSLSKAQQMVRDFHVKFGVSAPDEPTLVDWPALVQRAGWIDDELDELRESSAGGDDIAGVADAYIDIIVFALGGLVEIGVDASPLFDAVMAANNTKVKLPGVSKIAKPPGFVHPNIDALIEAQRRKP